MARSRERMSPSPVGKDMGRGVNLAFFRVETVQFGVGYSGASFYTVILV